ncbi:checkpoint protein HUS1 isoform X2 [Neophocaena asiaeorientalis asiaeorientalis]|uniref:Checkpoint protein HUS1 isoform X2 n=1 Tax=Neophocaena asiaeorientalis asiaeorientalis TaxID=1706337 RepID=A0A341BNT0_NEOAA|nr:checkpoint protein HUS1 isoform X2 [Neophocaena asiaeorientalis asiaeorientalis]
MHIGGVVLPESACARGRKLLWRPRLSLHTSSNSGTLPLWRAQLSVSSSSRVVTHDIPVKVIPRKLWKDLQEPTVPDADVSIYLPVLKTMKSIVEKMKNISNHLIIEANLNGELNLKIETELVCVTTHFKDLENPPLASENASQDRNSEQMAEVHIDIRKLLQFLAGQQVNPTKATCNIVKNKIVHFDLLHEDVSLQYFIPALS